MLIHQEKSTKIEIKSPMAERPSLYHADDNPPEIISESIYKRPLESPSPSTATAIAAELEKKESELDNLDSLQIDRTRR